MGSIYTGSRLHFKYTPIHNLVLLFFSFFLFCLYKLGSPPRLLPSSSTIPFNNISLTSTATHIGQHLATTYQVTTSLEHKNVRLHQKLLHLHRLHGPGGTLLPYLGRREPPTLVSQRPSRALHHAARTVPSLLRLKTHQSLRPMSFFSWTCRKTLTLYTTTPRQRCQTLMNE